MPHSTPVSSWKNHSTTVSRSQKGRKRKRSKDNASLHTTEEERVQLFLPEEHAIGISSEVEHILCETLLSHLAHDVKQYEQETGGLGSHNGNGASGSSRGSSRSSAPTSSTTHCSAHEEEGDASSHRLVSYIPFSCATAMTDWIRKALPPSSSPVSLVGSSSASGRRTTPPRGLYCHLHQCFARVVMQDFLQNKEAAPSSLRSSAFLCKLLTTVPEMLEDPLFWCAPTTTPHRTRNCTPGGPTPAGEKNTSSSPSRTTAHEEAIASMSWMTEGDLFAILLSTVLSPAARAATIPIPSCVPSPLPSEGEDAATCGESTRSPLPPPLRHCGACGSTPTETMVAHERMELAELYLLLSSGPWATRWPSQWGKPSSRDAAVRSGEEGCREGEGESSAEEVTEATCSSSVTRKKKETTPHSGRWEQVLLFITLRGITQLLQSQLLRLHDDSEAGVVQDPPNFSFPEDHDTTTTTLSTSSTSLFPLVSSTSTSFSTAHGVRLWNDAKERYETHDTPEKEPPHPSTILSIIHDAICHTRRMPTKTAISDEQAKNDEPNVANADLPPPPPSTRTPSLSRMTATQHWAAAEYRAAIQQALHLYFTAITTASILGVDDASSGHQEESGLPHSSASHSRKGAAATEQGDGIEAVENTSQEEENHRDVTVSSSPARPSRSPPLPTRLPTTPPLQRRATRPRDSTADHRATPSPPLLLPIMTMEEKKQQEAIAESILALDAFNAEQEAAEGEGSGGRPPASSRWTSRTPIPHPITPPLPSSSSSSSTTTLGVVPPPPFRSSPAVEDIEEYSDSEQDIGEKEERQGKGGQSAATVHHRHEETSTRPPLVLSDPSTDHLRLRKGSRDAIQERREPLSSATSHRFPSRTETAALPSMSSSSSSSFSLQAIYPPSPASLSRSFPSRHATTTMVVASPSPASFLPRPSVGVAAKKSRATFTPEEDNALLKGVTRFPGCTMSDFRTIFALFSNVWRPTRTPYQLRDHWRQVLKQRVEEQMGL